MCVVRIKNRDKYIYVCIIFFLLIVFCWFLVFFFALSFYRYYPSSPGIPPFSSWTPTLNVSTRKINTFPSVFTACCCISVLISAVIFAVKRDKASTKIVARHLDWLSPIKRLSVAIVSRFALWNVLWAYIILTICIWIQIQLHCSTCRVQIR